MAKCSHLGIHLRVRDGRFTELVFAQIRKLTRGRTAEVWIELKDTSIHMQQEIERTLCYNEDREERRKNRIKWNLVWDEGDLAVEGDAIMSIPDDLFFPPELIEEIRSHLVYMTHDQLRVRRLFCWDKFGVYNQAFANIFTTIIMGNTAKFPRILNLTNPALDTTLLTEEDRVFKRLAFPEVNKLLSQPVELVEVTCGNTPSQSDRT